MKFLPLSAKASFAEDSLSYRPPKNENSRILIVDDDESIRFLFHQKLQKIGLHVAEACSIQEAFQCIHNQYFDAILLDNYLQDGMGIELIPEISNISPHSKIIMLSAHGNIETAVTAMAKGASNFLLKSDAPDSNILKLCRLIFPPIESPSIPNAKLEHLGLLGHSAVTQKVYEKLEKISQVETTVLISGESGTGKELIARAVHQLSRRSKGPFIAINCGAISEGLLESELFGCKKGAYTDSKKDRKGYFETCNEGTLLLDEIGEMSPALQVKLLRVLQEREITPLGSCQPIKISTRIVAATNRNLKNEVKAGRFREDLYYRLAVIHLHLPPLRERKEDIPVLLKHFIQKFNRHFNKKVRTPTNSLLAKLLAYNWPGNIRELHNALERAILLADDDNLHIEDLIPLQALYENNPLDSASLPQNQQLFPLKYSDAKSYFEKHYVDQLLNYTHGNIMEAARISGQYRPNIYRLLKKYDIDPSLYK